MSELRPDYVEVWECPVPARGLYYQVLDQEWTFDDPPTRRIKRVAVAGGNQTVRPPRDVGSESEYYARTGPRRWWMFGLRSWRYGTDAEHGERFPRVEVRTRPSFGASTEEPK